MILYDTFLCFTIHDTIFTLFLHSTIRYDYTILYVYYFFCIRPMLGSTSRTILYDTILMTVLHQYST